VRFVSGSSLGMAIRDGRVAKGWSRARLAGEVVRQPQTVRLWETDRVRPPPHVLRRLAVVLDLPTLAGADDEASA